MDKELEMEEEEEEEDLVQAAAVQQYWGLLARWGHRASKGTSLARRKSK